MNSAGFLRVENLRKEFTKRGGALEVLKGISFTLERGEMLGVVGVSGAGGAFFTTGRT
jgi:ABC-type glutathione transport system ATPase component